MGYKITNKNVITNQGKNIVMDNVFYFQTMEQAEEYILAQKAFHELTKVKKNDVAATIEECTPEEDERYLFDQYNEQYNPNDMKLPNVVIERPIEIPKGIPYWVTRRELLIKK